MYFFGAHVYYERDLMGVREMYKAVVKILRKDALILKYKDAVLGNFYYEDIRPEIVEEL